MKCFDIRMQGGSGIWLGVVALFGAAVLLSVGFVLAAVLLILAVLARLPAWGRTLWLRRKTARGPVTIEGQYRRSEP